MGIFRKPADPLSPGPIRCAYCVDDYLAWLRDRPDSKEAPEVGQALTVLPAVGGEPGAGAAVCLVHLRALMRFRRHDSGNGAGGQPAEIIPPGPGTPLPRMTPRAATA